MIRAMGAYPSFEPAHTAGLAKGFLSFFGRAHRAGITCWWRSVVGFRGKPEYFREDRLQGIGPDLIRFERRMKLVGIHHAGKQSALLVRELVVNIEAPDFP